MALLLVFWSSRGLRQGDPLYPYIFVLGMDILSCFINKVVDGNSLTGSKFRVKGEEEDLVSSHLLYANDTLLFCKAGPNQLAHLGWILMWFEALSRLSINLGKREIFNVRGNENVEALATELVCKVNFLPSTYLGLSLRTLYKSVGVWDPIEEKI